jgi:hypothetical protein
MFTTERPSPADPAQQSLAAPGAPGSLRGHTRSLDAAGFPMHAARPDAPCFLSDGVAVLAQPSIPKE